MNSFIRQLLNCHGFRTLFVRCSVVFLIGYLFYSQWILIGHVQLLLQMPQRQQKMGTRYEVRLKPLRSYLPEHGTVGYASDTGVEHFLRAKYVLAPVVLDRKGGYALLVANYSKAEARPDIIYGRPYRVLQDFNDGVALLEMEQ
jgi:hypothetical protein